MVHRIRPIQTRIDFNWEAIKSSFCNSTAPEKTTWCSKIMSERIVKRISIRCFFIVDFSLETFAFNSRRQPGSPFVLTLYVNGVVDCRVSACCESKPKRRVPLEGQNSSFAIHSVQKANRACRYDYARQDVLPIGFSSVVAKRRNGREDSYSLRLPVSIQLAIENQLWPRFHHTDDLRHLNESIHTMRLDRHRSLKPIRRYSFAHRLHPMCSPQAEEILHRQNLLFHQCPKSHQKCFSNALHPQYW